MICFKDMEFCNNPNCTCPEWRRYTDAVRVAAVKWWGRPDAPVCVADVCKGVKR